jgi:hypothetical protein
LKIIAANLLANTVELMRLTEDTDEDVIEALLREACDIAYTHDFDASKFAGEAARVFLQLGEWKPVKEA